MGIGVVKEQCDAHMSQMEGKTEERMTQHKVGRIKVARINESSGREVYNTPFMFGVFNKDVL